jgi:hypothetical protein
VLFPCHPVGGGLSKSDERSEVWIEQLILENKHRVENSMPVGFHAIKESFVRDEKGIEQITLEVKITHIDTLQSSGCHFDVSRAGQSVASENAPQTVLVVDFSAPIVAPCPKPLNYQGTIGQV